MLQEVVEEDTSTRFCPMNVVTSNFEFGIRNARDWFNSFVGTESSDDFNKAFDSFLFFWH